MTSFPSLKSKADATTDNLNYYLAVSRPPGEMPLFMQITPGKSTVDAFGTDLETPGNYWLHFRAVSKREVWFTFLTQQLLNSSLYLRP